MIIHEDLFDGISILDVWRALGGGKVLRGRAQAFWRKGNGWNISLNPKKNCFYDFVAGKGGGIIDLIRVVLGSTRPQAVAWLRDFTGKARPGASALEREEHRRRVEIARAEAADVADFYERIAHLLAEYDHMNFHLFHNLKWRILNQDYKDDEELGALMAEAEEAERNYLKAEKARDQWRDANRADILKLYRNPEREK